MSGHSRNTSQSFQQCTSSITQQSAIPSTAQPPPPAFPQPSRLPNFHPYLPHKSLGLRSFPVGILPNTGKGRLGTGNSLFDVTIVATETGNFAFDIMILNHCRTTFSDVATSHRDRQQPQRCYDMCY